MANKVESEADPWTDLNFDDPELQKLLDEPLVHNKSLLRADEHFTGFDNNVGDTWIYPDNLPLRCYQFNITQAALYRNTLVVLPTGLGKTFIAAVVMYNLYRWYPTGKVIFMAPTRPLVAQQIEACQKIMPFPTEDTAELTGKLNKKNRTELWQSKRVFFATPQVVQSDISSAEEPDGVLSFPFARVKLVVVDEAHKAKGRYAYTEVLQSIWQRNRYFRVLALSATPGRTMEDVAQVVHNLFISHLEIRCDTSIDVSSYVHKRTMSTFVVSLSAEMEAIRNDLLEIIDPYLRQLIEADVLSGSLTNISRNWLLYEQKRFRERSMQQRHPKQSMVSSNFSVCISLYHALDLLERHGTRVFLNSFEEDEEGRAKFVVAMDRRLRELIERVRRDVGPNPFDVSAHTMTNGEIAEIPADLDFGHPKFEKARSCLLEHFQKNPESRAIVFCEYRESVMLVFRLLLQHRPLLKPRCFVGQGGTTGFLRALTQKQQIQIMSDFRSGVNNILIATCIGEEGIDVGEVDLIVCFDISTTNPTRFVQRIGRTGRQRQGAVIMLVTAGKEQAQLKEVLSNKDQINKKLAHSTVVAAALYKHSPRMVPTEFNPRCLKTYIKPPSPPPQAETKRGKKLAVNKNKIAGSQDLRKFFKKAPNKPQELDAEDLEVFVDDSKSRNSPQPPGAGTQISMEKSLNKINNYFGDLDLSNIAPAITQTQVKKPQTAKESTTSAATMFSLNNFESNRADHGLETNIDDERWSKLNKFLETECSGKTEKATPLTRAQLLEQLRSPDMMRVTKRIILIMNVDFVRETCKRMKALQAAEDNDEDDDEDEDEDEDDEEEQEVEECTINAADQETRDNYQLLLDIYEGKETLEKFLEDVELKEFKKNCTLPDEVLLADDDNEDFMKKLDEVFKGVEELGIYNDNWDYINEEYKKTRYYKKHMGETMDDSDEENYADGIMAESMVYEAMQQSSEYFSTQMDDVLQNEDLNITDSKYCSQWEQPARTNVPYNSTPVQGREAAKTNNNYEDVIEQSDAKGVHLMESVDCSNISSKYCTRWDEFAKRGVQQNSTPLPGPAGHSEKQTKKPRNIFSIYEEIPKKSVADAKVVETLSLSEGSGKTINSDVDKDAISPKPGTSTIQEIESTPEDLQLSVTAISKEEITRGISTLASTANKQIRTESELGAQSVNAMLEDFDFDAFLEPFPEECIDAAVPEVKASTSVPNEIALSPQSIIRSSPDIFENEMSPLKAGKLQTKLSLAGKLAARKPNNNMEKPSALRTPPKSLRPPQELGKGTEKSPSIYDMYMKHMRRHVLKSQQKERMSATDSNKSIKDESSDEMVVVRKRNPVSKRRVIESDSDEEAVEQEKENEGEEKTNKRGINDETDDTSSDEIQASQQKKSVPQRYKRRRLLCSFIEEEPTVSGSDVSADEAEFTLGHYVYDSIVVPNDEAEDNASTSQMQAMYLQSVKSPVNRRGAFKIPDFKVYNDIEQIYSQAVPVEKSQYVSDSFVVSEDDAAEEADASLCPLERAERILKEERRARRRYAKVAEVNNVRTKIRQRVKSSDEDFE